MSSDVRTTSKIDGTGEGRKDKKVAKAAPSPLVTTGGTTTKKVKAGSNWKKLQRTLGGTGESVRKLKAASTKRSGGTKATSSEVVAETSSSKNGKTIASEPWFADDLSPEDLELVKSGKSVSSSSALGLGGGVEEEVDEETMRRRKKAILGDPDLSKEKSEPGTYVAIDCEMVGVGPNGAESVLARVSLVNWHGASILDTFVRPREKVTDYRTWVSGVRPSDLKTAPTFQEVQDQVSGILKGRVLIGHAVQNDLKALLLSHPRPLLRDTSTFEPLRKLAKTKRPALRKLAKLVLGIDMQQKGEEHSSLQDARATMAIYRRYHAQWQEALGFNNKKGLAALQKGKRKRKEVESGEGDAGSTSEAKRPKKADALGSDWWKDL